MMSEPDQISNLVISAKDVPLAAYQAIYHRITKKTETFQKRYQGAYKITHPSISDFHHKLSQTMMQYNLVASNVEIAITLENDGTHTFSSFEKFSMFNLEGLSTKTLGFGMEIDFLIVLPNSDIDPREASQRYKVRITYNERESISIRRRITFTEDIDIEAILTALTLRVEYADYAVARNVQALVDEWINTLSQDDDGIISQRLQKFLNVLEDNIPFVGVIAPLLGGIIFEPQKYISILSPIRYLLAVLLVMVGGLAVTVWLSNLMSVARRALSPRTRLMFTAADFAADRAQCQLRKSLRDRCALILVGVLLAGIVAVGANYISARLLDPYSNSAQDHK